MKAQNKFSKIFETEEDWVNNPLIFIKEEKKTRDEFQQIVYEGPLMRKKKNKEEFQKSKSALRTFAILP